MSDKLKTSLFVAGIYCFIFLFVLASAAAEENTVWTKYTNAVPPGTSDTTNWGNGRIPLGTSVKGDDTHALYAAVIKEGSTYKMWYSGNDGTYRIYYATSPDGLTWTKCTNAVPDASNTTGTYGRIPLGQSGGDVNNVLGPCVIKEGMIQEGYTYKMWYGGFDVSSKYRIYYATCKQPPKACTIISIH